MIVTHYRAISATHSMQWRLTVYGAVLSKVVVIAYNGAICVAMHMLQTGRN